MGGRRPSSCGEGKAAELCPGSGLGVRVVRGAPRIQGLLMGQPWFVGDEEPR
jgi:hypothetical protein